MSVTNCWACHNSRNSSQDHDDAFTSAPYPTVWYCTANDKNRVIDYRVDVMREIDPKCEVYKKHNAS